MISYRNIIFNLSLIGTLFFGLVGVNAQSYPITVSTMITPPYSLKLSDYVESGYDRVQVNINPMDLSLVSYKVKLKLIIESYDGRVHIETDPNYLPAPVFLQGGIPEIITSYDIQELFNVDHLIFSGFSKNEYLRNKKIPENFYRIGFVLVDYNRASLRTGKELIVSNFGFTTAAAFLGDPPLLNLPAKQEKLRIYEPQHILFQWTPRHKSSPNSAYNAEYVFRLYEVWNEWADPNIIASTQQPIFEKVLTEPRLAYEIAEPVLLPGKKYVWTVQVRESEQRDLFRNNGMSEAYLFTYGDECKIPSTLSAEAINGPGIELKWQGAEGHTGYQLQYRQTGNSNWHDQTSQIDNARLYELNYSSRYEMRVKAECGSFESDYSQTIALSTGEEPLQHFQCGINSGAPITTQNPMTILAPGMLFTAGGFHCKVTGVSSSVNGLFSGQCLVTIPFYGYAKVLHTFDKIRINTDYQMISGKLVSVTDSAKNAEFMSHLNNELNPQTHGTGYSNEQLLQLLNSDRIVTVDHPIDSLVINENGDLVVTYENGDSEIIEVEEGEEVIVADSEGNQYVVSDGVIVDGNAALAAAGGGNGSANGVNNIDSALALLKAIHFAPASDATYGFDSLKYNELQAEYEMQEVLEEQYPIPFKAIATGGFDYAIAKLPSGDGFNKVALSFKTTRGPVTSSPANDGENSRITLIAPATGDVENLEAVYTLKDTADKEYQEKLGLLNLVAYDAQMLKVFLVPVNQVSTDFSEATIKSEINKIYSQAVSEWDLELHVPLNTDKWNINNDGIFDDTDPDNRMDYTPAMKALYREFIDQFGRDRDAYYVFLIDENHASDLSGYMPFNCHYSFIFTKDLGSDLLSKTIAHELGHGAFNLRHTFSNENKYQTSQGLTDNLMDYTNNANAFNLNKYQWDFVHDPEVILFNFLQEEDEGEFALPCIGIFDDCDDVLKKIDAIRTAYIEDKTITGKIPESLNERILTGTHLKLGDVEFDKIMVCLYGTADQEYTIDPKKYEEFWYTVSENSIDPESEILNGGFEFKFNDKHVLRVFVEDEAGVIQEKFRALKKYLFEEENKEALNNIFLNNVKWVAQTDSKIENVKGTENYGNCTYCSSWSTCSQDNKTCCNTCCKVTSFYIVKQSGGNPSISTKICELNNPKDATSGLTSTNFLNGISLIDKNLKNKKPVVIGVNNSEKTSIYNSFNPATHHFIVIIGKGYDEKTNKNFYYFHEVGTTQSTIGDGRNENTENKLIIDNDLLIITGTRPYGSAVTYTVTEVYDN